MRAWQIALVCTLVLASCGGDDQERPLPPAAADLSSPIAKPQRLRGDYEFEGRRRRVDVSIVPRNVLDPWKGTVVVPPKGARYVGVTVRFVNHGPDPFPHEWANFGGRDDAGRKLSVRTARSPLRKTSPDRPVRGQALDQIIGLPVPKGRSLSELRIGSIVTLFPFDARWKLPPP